MAKRTQNLKPDTVLKNYWSDNEQFADFFNAVLFEGEQVIRAEELEDADTEESSVLEHKDYAESLTASRDVIKVSRKASVHGVELVMLGVESQEHVHYAMPLRAMGYDYGTYKKQYDRNAKQYKEAEGLEEDEYLSRMKKTDRFMPVITIIVYYGEKPWDGAVSLHGMLHIPERMKPFVNDYKMMLVETRENRLIFRNMNNEYFFHMLEVVLDKSLPRDEAMQKVIDYARVHHVDKDVIMALAGATKCKIDYTAFDRKGEADMCTLFDEIARENEAKGIIETGFDFDIPENDILKRLQEKLDVPAQKAKEYLKMFRKQTV